ncbi:hypothetical protein [Niabella ginsengisoli]|uniref:RagB/SusD family nutrient uptake outer membrane protein n=1 Tax=Niabella ginsengisoli TaxID=522298 RepID=A0ABS9SKQ0_9BACT|nr:hypothetical protein [Niabella ginsengisoli]MCH5598935.1 hypothetical protein [Niabella ginsengisoli]
MKKLLYIITGFIGIISVYSCQKLDIAPIDRFTDDNYWTTPGRAELLLNMAYNQMYNADIMWRDEFLSDNMLQTYGASDTRTIRRGEATPALGLFNSEWGQSYGGIKTCLVFLNNVDKIPKMDEALKKE